MGSTLSILMAVLPGKEPPDEAVISGRLAPFLRALPREQNGVWQGGKERQAAWSRPWRSPEGDHHLLMSAKFDPEWFRFHVKMSRLSEEEQQRVRGARYGLFFSTRFDPAAPLAAFGR